jgi:hypothetical protein
MKGYLSTLQAAERLRVSGARIRQMIIDGLINDVEKIGQNNLIPEKEIKRLEALNRKPGRPISKKKKKK